MRLTFRPVIGLMTALAAGAACLHAPAVRAAEPSGPRSIFDDDFPSSPTATPTPAPTRPPVRPVAPEPDTPTPPKPTPPVRTEPPERVTPPPAEPVPDVAKPDAAKGDEVLPGLVAELYDGPDFGRVKETQLVRRVRVAFDRPASTVGAVVPMSFKWSGMVRVPAGGMTATFQVQSHGTVEVRVDGVPAVTGRGAADGKSVGRTMKLPEGLHPLVISVSQIRYGGGKEIVALSWQPDGEEMQAVPSAVLCHYRKDEPAASTLSADQGVKKPKAIHKGTLPVPSEAELVELHKRIKAKFATYYADATPIVRQTLARKLADEAGTCADPAERYALLREAADVSAAAGDLKGAMLCVESLATAFNVNEPDLQLTVLTAASHTAKTPATAHGVGEAAMQLADDAADADEYDVAFRAASLAETALTAAKDDDAGKARARAKELRELQQQFAHIAPLMKKLHETPDDADANMKAGRFLCFTAGRWEKGLPMLAKGSDAALKALAEAEARSPSEADAQLKLGDSWWDHAGSESLVTAARCKDRACYWYLQARATNAAGFPSRALQRLSVLSRTIDLLAQVDVDAVAPGGWKRDHGALVRIAPQNPQIPLPYQPFGDYDFIVEYSPAHTNNYFVQTMPVNGRLLSWSLNNTYANFTPLALQPGSWGPMLRGQVLIQPGHKYTSVVQFRRTGVRAIVNGVLIREWATDYKEVASFGNRGEDAKCLSLVCNDVDTVIHTIKVVEVPHPVK